MEPLDIEPSGIFMQTDFITEAHEVTLVNIFSSLPWPERKGRLSLHYGYTFSYQTFGIAHNIPFIPFPDWLLPLLPTTEGRSPDQVCLQHYAPGTGIPPHIDTHSAFDQLYSLSFGSPIVMQFKDAGEHGTGRIVDVDLPTRSLMKMSGASRLHWTHGIRSRKTDLVEGGKVRVRRDRWSLTYRWLREPAICECGDAKLCDTMQRKLGIQKEYRWKATEKGGQEGKEETRKGVVEGEE